MFVCTNCKKEKADNEQGDVGWLGNIGFLLVAKAPWWPSKVCKNCSKQVRLFGIACIFVFGVLIVFIAFVNW
jgi:hypothetical protein